MKQPGLTTVFRELLVGVPDGGLWIWAWWTLGPFSSARGMFASPDDQLNWELRNLRCGPFRSFILSDGQRVGELVKHHTRWALYAWRSFLWCPGRPPLPIVVFSPHVWNEHEWSKTTFCGLKWSMVPFHKSQMQKSFDRYWHISEIYIIMGWVTRLPALSTEMINYRCYETDGLCYLDQFMVLHICYTHVLYTCAIHMCYTCVVPIYTIF